MDFEEVFFLNKLQEKLEDGKLNEENWKELNEKLNKFISQVSEFNETIEDRYKNREEIGELNGFINSAKNVLKKINSPEIRKAVHQDPQAPVEDLNTNQETKGESE